MTYLQSFTLMMASTQVVETSVKTNNSPSQDHTTNPDDHSNHNTDSPGFKPFTVIQIKCPKRQVYTKHFSQKIYHINPCWLKAIFMKWPNFMPKLNKLYKLWIYVSRVFLINRFIWTRDEFYLWSNPSICSAERYPQRWYKIVVRASLKRT